MVLSISTMPVQGRMGGVSQREMEREGCRKREIVTSEKSGRCKARKRRAPIFHSVGIFPPPPPIPHLQTFNSNFFLNSAFFEGFRSIKNSNFFLNISVFGDIKQQDSYVNTYCICKSSICTCTVIFLFSHHFYCTDSAHIHTESMCDIPLTPSHTTFPPTPYTQILCVTPPLHTATPRTRYLTH